MEEEKDLTIKTHRIPTIIARVLAGLAAISTGIFLFFLLSLAVLPAKFAIPVTAVFVLLAGLTIFFAIRNKSRKSRIASIVISIILLIVTIPLSIKLAETKGFLDSNFSSFGDGDQSTQTVDDEPFLVYLQGIDTRTDSLPEKSLADVNLVAGIDPAQHKILLVAIPRDSYVHIHDTPANALNDKLTHAGSIGGLELSKATIEDLLDVELPHYVRVNFNFVKGLVDAIGGINLYSDQSTAFTCWTDKNCTFQPGDNFVYGDCALAFARERKAYDTGDRHRGENQEQVISSILSKVASSSTLLSSYSDILGALNGTFETNFTVADVTTLIRDQLDNLKGWSTESYNINGTGAKSATYSYPNQQLYVMNLDESTVTTAKEKLQAFLQK